MSTNILSIDSSILGEHGVSVQLSGSLLEQLSAKFGDVSVTHRDLGSDPIPYFDGATLAALSEGKAALADTLIDEVMSADIIVIGAPMYNFTIPAQLKSWLDHIARAGTTFRYTESGAEGLVTGKKVIVLFSRGGVYSNTPADTQTPYMQTILGFMGMTDVEFIYAEGLALGEESRTKAIASAEAAVTATVQALEIA